MVFVGIASLVMNVVLMSLWLYWWERGAKSEEIRKSLSELLDKDLDRAREERREHMKVVRREADLQEVVAAMRKVLGPNECRCFPAKEE